MELSHHGVQYESFPKLSDFLKIDKYLPKI